MNDFARKELGQHWLNDETVLSAICDAAEVGPDDTVLEIGPGMGALTKPLAERAKKVIAVEKDGRLAESLTHRVAHNVQIITGDILQYDLNQLPVGYKVVANIPYYLTSNLLRVLCESSNPFSHAAVLVQKEVAERVTAAPGNMSLLAVSVQFYCSTGLGPVVPAALFFPPPKVDSQVLLLTYNGPRFDVDTDTFFRLVKAGFSEKRKKLKSSLSGGLGISRQEAVTLLAGAGIDSDSRAQELPLDAWHALYKVVHDG